MTDQTAEPDDLPARLQAVLTERYTELGNPFSEMRRHEQAADGWPASHPVGPHGVAEVLRELLAAPAAVPVPPPGQTDHRAQLLDALDFAYCQGLGYDTPEALLAAYDASRAVRVPPPADQTSLRQRIAEALIDWAYRSTDRKYTALRRDETVRANAYSRAAAVLAVLPEQTDRAALERVRAVLETEAVVGRSALEYRGLIASALMAAEEQPAETPMFGSPDCTCIPFTRQGGKPRYCGPTDTVDMISGWEIGRDCPHHKPAVGEQPETQEADRG